MRMHRLIFSNRHNVCRVSTFICRAVTTNSSVRGSQQRARKPAACEEASRWTLTRRQTTPQETKTSCGGPWTGKQLLLHRHWWVARIELFLLFHRVFCCYFSESSESCSVVLQKRTVVVTVSTKHRCFYVRHDHHRHDFRVLTATAARRTKCLH
jgi:hypothetical protein